MTEKIYHRLATYCWRIMSYLYLALRKLAHWLLLMTSHDWTLLRKRGSLRLKIVSRKREPFVLNVAGNYLRWCGKEATVGYAIPDEISEGEARALCQAQLIDPWFADLLFERLTSWAIETATE